MTDEPTLNYLPRTRPGRLTAYVNKFGFPFPSPQTVKMASSFGMMDELEKMLNEHVKANEPVTDWDAFALELRERVGREYAGQSVSDMRARAIESGQVRGDASGDGTSAPDVAGAIRRVQTPQELDRLRARMAQAFGAKITGGVLPQAPTSEPRDE